MEKTEMILGDAQQTTWSDALIPIWLSVLSVAGGLVAVWKIRESNHVRELVLKLDIADRERVRLTERITSLEKKAASDARIADQREVLIADMERRSILQKAEIRGLTRLLRKYEQAGKEALIETDEHGLVKSWDAAATIVFGYTADEAVGKDISLLIVPPAIRQLHRDSMERVRYLLSSPVGSGGTHYQTRPLPISTTAQNQDGELFPVEVKIFQPWPDTEGKLRFAASIKKLTLPSQDAIPAGLDSFDSYKPSLADMAAIQAAHDAAIQEAQKARQTDPATMPEQPKP